MMGSILGTRTFALPLQAVMAVYVVGDRLPTVFCFLVLGGLS